MTALLNGLSVLTVAVEFVNWREDKMHHRGELPFTGEGHKGSSRVTTGTNGSKAVVMVVIASFTLPFHTTPQLMHSTWRMTVCVSE